MPEIDSPCRGLFATYRPLAGGKTPCKAKRMENLTSTGQGQTFPFDVWDATARDPHGSERAQVRFTRGLACNVWMTPAAERFTALQVGFGGCTLPDGNRP